MDSESESSKRYVEGCRRILNEFESHERAAIARRKRTVVKTVEEIERLGKLTAYCATHAEDIYEDTPKEAHAECEVIIN